MRTAEEWFETLPTHIGSRAKSNINPLCLKREYKGLHEALMYAFSWSESLEGWAYWARIADGLNKEVQH